VAFVFVVVFVFRRGFAFVSGAVGRAVVLGTIAFGAAVPGIDLFALRPRTVDAADGRRATAFISTSRFGCGSWCTATVVRAGAWWGSGKCSFQTAFIPA
jgi:hypothetical protein